MYIIRHKGGLELNIFSEILKHFEGKTVRTYIIHKIYGAQRAIVRNFCPLYSDNKVGFIVNNHEIFMYYNEIKNYEFNGSVLKLNGSLRNIVVEKV